MKQEPTKLRKLFPEVLKFKAPSSKTVKETLIEVKEFESMYWVNGVACRARPGEVNACLGGAVALACGWNPTVRVRKNGDIKFSFATDEVPDGPQDFESNAGWNLFLKTMLHLSKFSRTKNIESLGNAISAIIDVNDRNSYSSSEWQVRRDESGKAPRRVINLLDRAIDAS